MVQNIDEKENGELENDMKMVNMKNAEVKNIQNYFQPQNCT